MHRVAALLAAQPCASIAPHLRRSVRVPEQGCQARAVSVLFWALLLHLTSFLTQALTLQVNAGVEELQGMCEALGVAQLPFFQIYNKAALVSHFSANLQRVDRLRLELAKLQELPAAAAAGAQLPAAVASLQQLQATAGL